MSTKYSYVGKFSDSGSTNGFYKLKGKKYGFKSFPNKSLASFSHAVQSDLSRDDLTPRVYSPVCKIRVPNYFAGNDGKGNFITITKMVLSDWGYLTEIANPYSCDDPECEGCCVDYGCNNYYHMCDVVDDIKEYGIDYTDVHPGNFGYIKRGKHKKLVVIDLGRESIGDVDDHYPEVCWDGVSSYCQCEQCQENYHYA